MFGPPVFVSFLQTGLRGQVNGAVLSVADKTRTYCICHGGAGTGLAPSVLFGLCLRLIALSYLIVFSCPRPIFRIPHRSLSLPHRDYSLAPERRKAALCEIRVRMA
jgi:hypothetical protein